MSAIQLKNITKSFNLDQENLPVLNGLSLYVNNREFVSLLGPSGCGKSTLFNIICGLINPDRGEVIVGEKEGMKAKDVVSYMPQKDLLLPWRTVLENVILAREVAGENKETVKKEAAHLLPLFGLEGFQNSFPAELSGGMRQRAALMRTMLAQKEVLLLDEPFGALDAITRTRMQRWLLDVWNKFRQAVFFVTHDIDEALFLSDRVYVLTPRPARISLELKVELPRPRRAGILTTSDFLQQKRKVMHVLAME
ncbi:MAG: ABC transporter ATP-binding protein [Firmicutes bacterium]|nr:ABC transporter ATP-binding protein [Bacillota bacterium]